MCIKSSCHHAAVTIFMQECRAGLHVLWLLLGVDSVITTFATLLFDGERIYHGRLYHRPAAMELHAVLKKSIIVPIFWAVSCEEHYREKQAQFCIIYFKMLIMSGNERSSKLCNFTFKTLHRFWKTDEVGN